MADDPQPTGDEGAKPPGTDDGQQPPDLGDKGKAAITAIRGERDAARNEAKSLREELDKLQRAQMTDHEKAVNDAKAVGRTEALSEINGRLFAAEAKAAAAAAKFADPTLLGDPDVARKLLGFTEVPVTPSGDIDTEAISKAVAKVATERPYLVGATPPPLDLGQGARGGQPHGPDMNAAIRRAAGRT